MEQKVLVMTMALMNDIASSAMCKYYALQSMTGKLLLIDVLIPEDYMQSSIVLIINSLVNLHGVNICKL